jgi:GNAT superfamily N-acetyltransferase
MKKCSGEYNMTIFRPAYEADLQPMYEVFYQNEVLDSPHQPSPGDIPSYLRHVLQTGTLAVAEQDGTVLAFAGAITRGNITFLTDLFVRPDHQSGQLGKTLLHSVLPQDNLVHCTMSSSDPRALALYIRAGMRPQWPHFALRLEKPTREKRVTPGIEIIEADAGDPALVRWDTQISGRLRPMDHLYWVREQGAVPLWFRRQGQIVGYGYIRLGAGTLWYPQACVLGPIGVSAPEDATACVLAAVDWALQQADVLCIDVPGPHPCLATLLETGFRITYVDTFVSTAATPFFDARCYIASGGDLL